MPKTKKTKNRIPSAKLKRRRFKKKKPSILKAFGSSIYQIISSLPFVPAPIKAISDVIAHQIGLTGDVLPTNPGYSAGDVSPCYMAYAFSVNAAAFTIGSAYFPVTATSATNVLSHSNYKSIRPKSFSITVKPQNPVAHRDGFYYVGIQPMTGSTDITYWKSFKLSDISTDVEVFMGMFAIKRRTTGSGSVSLSYTVPATNSFLHMGQDIRSNFPIFVVFILFSCCNRDKYKDFTANDFDVSIKFSGTCDYLDFVPFGESVMSGNFISDILTGQPGHLVSLKHSSAVAHFDGKYLNYDEQRKTMVGKLELLTANQQFEELMMERSFVDASLDSH